MHGGSKRLGTSSDEGFEGKAHARSRHPFLVLVFQASRPIEGGARFALAGIEEIVIGRGGALAVERGREGGRRRLTLAMNSRGMSTKHARIRRTTEGWVADDMQSKNGVFINGERMRRSTVVEAGDVLTLGHAFFRVEYLDAEEGVGDLLAIDVTGALPGTLTLLPSFQAQLANLAAIAATRTPVTLVGETGVGKELIARAIHRLSGRDGPYAAINCAGLARTLIESELFGYVKGAFSGAVRNHPGHVQAADGGTLLLDEILAAPAEFQTALLRVLQEGQVTPVGARKPTTVDVRFVAATQRPLQEAVVAEGFRLDLKARLEGFVLYIPSLRERRIDAGIFIAHALRAHGADDAAFPTFKLPAVLRLLRQDFPGNIRDLATAVGRATTLAAGRPIDEEHLLLPEPYAGEDDSREEETEQLRQSLVASLRLTGGDVAEAARSLGRNRTLVYKWIQRFEIELEEFRKG